MRICAGGDRFFVYVIPLIKGSHEIIGTKVGKDLLAIGGMYGVLPFHLVEQEKNNLSLSDLLLSLYENEDKLVTPAGASAGRTLLESYYKSTRKATARAKGDSQDDSQDDCSTSRPDVIELQTTIKQEQEEEIMQGLKKQLGKLVDSELASICGLARDVLTQRCRGLEGLWVAHLEHVRPALAFLAVLDKFKLLHLSSVVNVTTIFTFMFIQVVLGDSDRHQIE